MYWSTNYSKGAWVIDDYATSKWALTSPHFSAQRASRWLTTAELANAHKRLGPFKDLLSESVVFLEDDKHKATRKRLVECLRAAMSAGFECRLRLMVAETINAAVGRRAIDVVREVAQFIPMMSICDLLGITIENREEFIDWCKSISEFLGEPIELYDSALRAQNAALAMTKFFNTQIHSNNFIHDDSKILFSLLRSDEFGGTKNRRALFAQLGTLFFGAYETTQNLISNAFWAFSEFPLEYEKLKASPYLIDSVIEEILRYFSPVQYTGRVILSDTTVNGLHLKRGELIIVDIAKANRDPAIFDNPNKFDIARVESKHLAFGYGHHFCIGSRLSVLELKIVLQNLIGGAIDLRRLGKPIPLTNTLYKGFSCLPMEMVRPL